jgi:hypothetical protein
VQRRGLRAVVVGSALAVAPTGCTTVVTGQAVPPEARSIEAGRCYMTFTPERLSPGNAVDCGDEHGVEVLAVRRLPPDLASRDRRDLVSEQSGPSKLFAPRAWEICEGVLLEESGLVDVLDLPEAPALREALAVTPLASLWAFPTLPQNAFWSKGEHTVACAVTYLDHMGYPETLTWKGGEPMFSSFTTGNYRGDLRWCEAYPDDAAGKVLGCDDPHDWEAVFEFEGSAVLDPALLSVIDPGAESSGQFRVLAGACASLAPGLVRRGIEEAGIVGTPAPDWGRARVVGGPPTHRVECGVVSPEDRMIVGSVFDEDVHLVPR